MVYWQPLEQWDNKYINHAKDAVTRSNFAQLTKALKVEDAKPGACSTNDPRVCVNEFAANANMKDPYSQQNLIILSDSDSYPLYSAPYVNYPQRQWPSNAIELHLCEADANFPQFSPDLSGPSYSTKHFALKATLLSGETIFQILDFVNLTSGIWACGG